jgi:hypothetical protein
MQEVAQHAKCVRSVNVGKRYCFTVPHSCSIASRPLPQVRVGVISELVHVEIKAGRQDLGPRGLAVFTFVRGRD